MTGSPADSMYVAATLWSRNTSIGTGVVLKDAR